MALRTCVIYNPAAGRGKARRLLAGIAGRYPGAETSPTRHPGHAVELAEQAVADGFERIVAAGGDGTVHEVANGILLGGRRDVIFSTWPAGSMNDYAYTLGLGRWRDADLDGPLEVIDADVGLVRAGDRSRFFVNGIGFGFNGMVTIESQKIRSLRGLPLYTLAFLRAMWRHFATPMLTLRFNGKESTGPTLALSVNLGQREGGFPVTHDARLADGLFDVLHVGAIRRWELVRYLPALITGSLPSDHSHLRRDLWSRVELRSETPLCVHTDGEIFCRPEDGVREWTVEVLAGRLKVEASPRYKYGRGK